MPVSDAKAKQEIDDILIVKQKVKDATLAQDAAKTAFDDASSKYETAKNTLIESRNLADKQLDYSVAVLKAYANDQEIPDGLEDPTPDPIV